ncbi:hypothetical protein DS2_00575 [Catenovulum agarivorans DS-2]|uniref:Uncharacterized protein n=1 Tax=Catenovulum agarivorans DS-2 TaxID=1328313 RepID=W7QT29_9ALTE|nr:hypothetical protein [Catenovulum agarivorans]EWH12172.1 hypothetical protein DS2_00575 [Catenovulum agarivorans DS-2]
MINTINSNPFSTTTKLQPNDTAKDVQSQQNTSTTNINSKQAEQLVGSLLSASPEQLLASVSASKMNVAHALSLVD